MKRIIFGIILGCITFGIIVFLQFESVQKHYEGYQIVPYKLEGKNYHLLVADNADKWERGLMFYRELKGVDGMIFSFPDEDYRTFWNKSTYMDLDIYWINKEVVMGKSELPAFQKVNQIVTVNSSDKVDTVVELVK
jgi:uncharacterized membrane protein (UPF0127 family)